MGYAFPAWRGGILFWAEDGVEGGFKRVADRLNEFADKLGKNNPQVKAFYKPCDYLVQQAQKQGSK